MGTNLMTDLGTDKLAELITQKRDCLTHLRDIGVRQLDTARSGEMELLMQLLAIKQRLLDQMLRIENQLKPFRDQDSERRTWATPKARQECAIIAKTCEALLDEIVQQEKQSEKELVRRRDDAEVRLQGTHVASQVHTAYATGDAPTRSAVDYP